VSDHERAHTAELMSAQRDAGRPIDDPPSPAPDGAGAHQDRWSYAGWVDALCAHYFGPEMAGLPVMFLIDEDHLASFYPSGDGAEAVADASSPGAIDRRSSQWGVSGY